MTRAVCTCDKASTARRVARLNSRRIAAVEPVFANLRRNKRLGRVTLRGRAKFNTPWQLFCLVHNIEKLAKNGRSG